MYGYRNKDKVCEHVQKKVSPHQDLSSYYHYQDHPGKKANTHL